MSATEPRVMTPLEIGWLAGIVEGEGCVTNQAKTAIVLSVAMTDEDVVRRLQTVTGFGTINYRERSRPNTKPQWTWRVSVRDEVRYLLETILPHMGERRSGRIQAALARLDNNPGKERAKCGSVSGWHRHLRLGEPSCEPCRLAKYTYNKRRAERRFKRTGEICSVPGCTRIVHYRSWCGAHYQRWLKYGDPLKTKLRRPGMAV